MGKAKIRKKIKGIEKQTRLHADKMKEAFERDDEGAINYMGREIKDFLKIKEKLTKKILPKKKRNKN